MTGLGLSGGMPSGEVSATLKTGWLRHFRVALSGASGAALVIAVVELLQKQPAEGFKLLTQWGPWPVIVLVALVMVGSFFSRMNETVQTTFGAIVTGVERQAEASGKTADALTRLADQSGKQFEEVRRLSIYAAQEFPAIYDRFDQLDAAIRNLSDGVKGLHWAVNVKGAQGDAVPANNDGERGGHGD